jgi:hypothetical protein
MSVFCCCKNWAVELVEEIGDTIAERPVENASRNVGFGVSDYKAYLA